MPATRPAPAPRRDHPTPPPTVTWAGPPQLTGAPYAKPAAPPESLAEAVAALVDKAAERLLWRQFGTPGHRGITRERLKADLWATPEGKALVTLSRCRWANKPKAEALRAIAASPENAARYAEGLRVLAQGFPIQ
jgi:hypothetical protein